MALANTLGSTPPLYASLVKRHLESALDAADAAPYVKYILDFYFPESL